MDAARRDSMEMFRGSPDAAATIGRFRHGGIDCDLDKMEKALSGTFLDIHSNNESTIHPTNVLQDLVRSVRRTNGHCSHVFDHWASELEKDAEMVCQGEKGRKYIFLLNSTCGVLQIMRRLGASFSNAEVVSRLNSMIHRYTKSYIDECWVPLNKTLCSNLDEFTAKFLTTCDNQRTWKVTAELRYDLREEIVDLIVPLYKSSLSALEANQSPLSRVLCFLDRAIIGKKKQKKYTAEELEKEIRGLFEG